MVKSCMTDEWPTLRSSVFGRTYTKASGEGCHEMRQRAKPGIKTDLSYRKRGVAQQNRGMLQANSEQILMGTVRSELLEQAAEMEFTDKRVSRYLRQTKTLMEVRMHV